MSFARRDWFSESARLLEQEAKTKAASEGGGASFASGSGGNGGGGAAPALASGCLGAAKSMALMPVKAGSVAANQVRD